MSEPSTKRRPHSISPRQPHRTHVSVAALVLAGIAAATGAAAASSQVGNGRTYAATVSGYDGSHDIAVLQLRNAAGLATADIGNSASASVGQAVTALGNAGGIGGTPSSAVGSVTALNRSITATDTLGGTNERLTGLMQVSANVQSGDSGGALVDGSGQVIGVDAAASAPSSSQPTHGGDGFAIPINTAIAVARQIEAGHRSPTVHIGATAFLGVLVQAPSGPAGGSAVTSPVISAVAPGGAAAKAGLTAGDSITSVNGRTVTSAAALNTIVDGLKPGQSVCLGYSDAYGHSQNSTVTLDSGPPA